MAPPRRMQVQYMLVPVVQMFGDFTRSRRDGLWWPSGDGGCVQILPRIPAENRGPLMHRYHIPDVFLYLIYIYIYIYQLEPHKAVAEVSKIGNL